MFLIPKKKVLQQKSDFSIQQLEKLETYQLPRRSLQKSLLKKQPCNIIAEIKFHSPSHGLIHSHQNSQDIAKGYQLAGASGVSILTENDFFQGKSVYLTRAREILLIPILRKDFIIDEYQIIESRAIGADAILLISACLTPNKVKKFTRLAHQIGLEVLLEVHSKEELQDYFFDEIDILGVNNRNLKTLLISLETSLELAKKIPANHCKISESGLQNSIDIGQLLKVGYNGFLIGENFMKEKDPPLALKKLLKQL